MTGTTVGIERPASRQAVDRGSAPSQYLRTAVDSLNIGSEASKNGTYLVPSLARVAGCKKGGISL